MKESLFYSIDLTTQDTTNIGFKKKREDVTRSDIKRALKACIQSVRQKAVLRGWKCIIYPVISELSGKHGYRKSPWHVHLLVYGSPCSEICKEIKDYWVKRGYGSWSGVEIKRCKNGGKLWYNLKQETGTPRLMRINVGLTYENIGVINKKNVLRFYAGYKT